MPNITYAVIGDGSRPSSFAKRGTESDIVLFNGKARDVHMNLVQAARFPERLGGMLAALDMCDELLIHPARLDRSFGEQIVGASLFAKTRGWARVDAGADSGPLRQILTGAGLENVQIVDELDGVFRERLYQRQSAIRPGPTVVPCDHAFPVKGIGTVVLGLVRQGQVAKHQTLQAYPEGRNVDVRSVQVHDVDHAAAGSGSRVGLAIKGADAEQLGRGVILAEPGSLEVVEAGHPLTVAVQASAHSKWKPRASTTLHVYHCLQDIVLRIDRTRDVEGGFELDAKLEAPLALVPRQPTVLVDLDNAVQRFVGTARIDT